MTLQDQLDTITQNTRALVQPERLAVSEAAISELFASGIERRVLKSGAQAPRFTLQDGLTGKSVTLADVLALGPVILKFFRGRWCPYCVTELERWRDLHIDLRRKGAFLLAISPQTRRQNTFAAEQHALPFPVLSDPAAEVASRYGLTYAIPPQHRAYYRAILVNIPFAMPASTTTPQPKQAGHCRSPRPSSSGRMKPSPSPKHMPTSMCDRSRQTSSLCSEFATVACRLSPWESGWISAETVTRGSYVS